MNRRLSLVFVVALALLLGMAQTVSAGSFFWIGKSKTPTATPVPTVIPLPTLTPVPTQVPHKLIVQFPDVTLDSIEVFRDDSALHTTAGPATDEERITLPDSIWDLVLHQGAGTQSWQNVLLKNADYVLRDLVCGINVGIAHYDTSPSGIDSLPLELDRIAVQTAAGGDLIGEDSPADPWSATVLKSFDPEPDVWWLNLVQGAATYRQAVDLTCRYGAANVSVEPLSIATSTRGLDLENWAVYLCDHAGDANYLVMETGPINNPAFLLELLPDNSYQFVLTDEGYTWTTPCISTTQRVHVQTCDLELGFDGYSVAEARLYNPVGNLVDTVTSATDEVAFERQLAGDYDIELDITDSVSGNTYTQYINDVSCDDEVDLNDIFCPVTVTIPTGLTLDSLSLYEQTGNRLLSTRTNVSGTQTFQVLNSTLSGTQYQVTATAGSTTFTVNDLGCGAANGLFCAVTANYPGVTADTIRLLTNPGGTEVASATSQADQWSANVLTGNYNVEITDNTVVKTYAANCSNGTATVTDIVCPWRLEFTGVTGIAVLKTEAGGDDIERQKNQSNLYTRTLLQGSYWGRLRENLPGGGSFFSTQSTKTFDCNSTAGTTTTVPVCSLSFTIQAGSAPVESVSLYTQDAELVQTVTPSGSQATFSPHIDAKYNAVFNLTGGGTYTVEKVTCANGVGMVVTGLPSAP